MQYIEAPNNEEILFPENSIFLAGGITNCFNWQTIIVESLKKFDDLTVCNPRRQNYGVFLNKSDPLESKIQIEWEYKYLRKTSSIVFWFSNETVQPIALFELGSAIERKHQDLYVGVDKKYVRSFDVEYQLKCAGYPYDIIPTTFEAFKSNVVMFQENIVTIAEIRKKTLIHLRNQAK